MKSPFPFRRSLASVLLLLLAGARPAAAQDDEAWYRNFGFNLGYGLAQPQFAPLDGFRDRFNRETAFGHEAFRPGSLLRGFAGGFSFYSFNWTFSFDYRALGLENGYRLQPEPAAQPVDWKFKLYQHSGRWSLGWGKSWGRYGTTGIYVGGAVYGGTWMMKTKEAGDKKYDAYTGDDFRGFMLGLAPQLTLRCYLLEVKAYYDVPFWSTNLAPLYDAQFGRYGAASAAGDASLRGRLGSFGLVATAFIPFGKPSPRPAPSAGDEREYRRALDQMEGERQRREQRNREESQDRIRQREREYERRERSLR